MNSKLLSGIIIFLIISLSMILLIKKKPTLVIITNPKPYAISKTDDTEYIKIPLLTNNIDSYHFNPDYIVSSKITNQNKETFTPITIKEIIKTGEQVLYKDTYYDVINIVFNSAVSANDLHESFKDAWLNLTYENKAELHLNIGTYDYIQNNYVNYDIGLSNLYATHGIIKDSDTITGVFIELDNKQNSDITITKIEAQSSAVMFDNFAAKLLEENIEINQSVANILSQETYNHYKDVSASETMIIIPSNQSRKIYIPLAYYEDTRFIYRFPIKITYTINDEIKYYYIDDFPYINTLDFKEEQEKGYELYEFQD